MKCEEWTTYNPPSPQIEGQPSTINYISYRRHRVVVEEIEESDEVLRDRLMKLCERGTNPHQSGAWHSLERRYGFIIGRSYDGTKSRIANVDDRARWAKEDEDRAKAKAQKEEREEAERKARNAKANARRNAKKAAQ